MPNPSRIPELSCGTAADFKPQGVWQRELQQANRTLSSLISILKLPPTHSLRNFKNAELAAERFRLLVTDSFLNRMEQGNWHDPLLKQILPTSKEVISAMGGKRDPVGDRNAKIVPGLLKKYPGRVLLILGGHCAVNCRYCFRRNYAYSEEPKSIDQWEPALNAISQDASISEVILSGGDPLVHANSRLQKLLSRLISIPHVRRLRIHSRLPIVLPSRVDADLIALLKNSRLTPIVVVHANHSNEIVDDCADVLEELVSNGVTTLNQSVLLKGINDSAETLIELSDRLVNLGVLPYYLHQFDQVAGAMHFEVEESKGREIVAEMRTRLPGYAVPNYVREVEGELHKTPL